MYLKSFDSCKITPFDIKSNQEIRTNLRIYVNDSQLLIIATGGTIDKTYGIGAGVRELSFSRDPAVVDILREVQSVSDFPVVRLMAKDSLDMTDTDRAIISAMCSAVPQNRILITHGTDTMHKTAAAIAAKKTKKTIVITGAGQPAIMKGSDANFNAGFALSSTLTAGPGVYIAMNAQLYIWDKCKKNPTTGIFEPI
jgi:L-asparaginase